MSGGVRHPCHPPKRMNNNNIIIPPISPTGGSSKNDIKNAILEWCGEDTELLEAWMSYAEMRQRIRHPIATVNTVRRSCATLERLSGGDREYMLGLLHKATDKSWRGIYDLEPGDEGYKPKSSQPVEEIPDL